MNKQDIIEACKAEHGKVASVELEDRLYVFRKPKGAELKRMSRESDTDVFRAAFNLLAATMVHPTTEKMDHVKWIEDEYGNALLNVSVALQKMSGSEIAVQIEGN